jgi:hypothetical protein
MIEQKLKYVRDFQSRHPNSHIGGSIGLMIHGVRIGRSLEFSDLDIVVDVFDKSSKDGKELKSSSNDFEFVLTENDGCDNHFKIDIKVDKSMEYCVLNEDGYDYNVSLLSDIMFYKRLYSFTGVFKHYADIEFIETGVRPIEAVDEYDLLFL